MLDIKDYFKVDNHYLTRSKISQFFVCPNYFYRLNIEGSIQQKSKDCFVIGSAVDNLLAQIENKDKYLIMNGDLRIKANREEKADMESKGYIVLKPADYENIMSLAIAVEQTSAYQALKDHERQKLLQMPYKFENGLFNGLAALPDFCKIEGTHAILTDLKTANNFKVNSWHYHCLDYGYYLQFALQTLILSKQGITSFTYRHIVVDKTPDVNQVYAIEISPDLIDINDLIERIDIISKTKEFKKKDASWDNVIFLTDPSEDW